MRDSDDVSMRPREGDEGVAGVIDETVAVELRSGVYDTMRPAHGSLWLRSGS